MTIEEFCEAFRKVLKNKKYYLYNQNGTAIRFKNTAPLVYCPITLVCSAQKQKNFLMCYVTSASDELGLSTEDMQYIVDSSDYNNNDLRKRFLQILQDEGYISVETIN